MRNNFQIAFGLVLQFFKYRRILWATTLIEFDRRYAGSLFGKIWIFLHPLLLLSIYLFVYMVIFRMKFPGYSQLSYVLFVFCGLIPYIGFSEAVTSGCLSVKSNMHLVKNVMFPIELIPVRTVFVSMVTQLVSMGIVIILSLFEGFPSIHLIWLPLIFILQVIFLIGLVWILSCLAIALPDVSYFVNLFVLFLMFISPIGFKPEMVPVLLKIVVYFNPIFYMTEMYRSVMLYGKFPNLGIALVYIIMSVGAFVFGGVFFKKFKGVLVDYE
jgi:lipopolysaccharide transport system permease protein